MFERIDREADGEVYVNEVLDFLRSISSDLDQVEKDTKKTVCTLIKRVVEVSHVFRVRR